MIEYDLPFDEYERCPVCRGYGGVNLSGYGLDLLEQWQEKLKSPYPVVNGYNPCYNCNMSGRVYVCTLPELELEKK